MSSFRKAGLSVGAAAIIGLAGGSASAQEGNWWWPAQEGDPGAYIGGAAGWNWPDDEDIEGGGVSPEAEFDSGWVGLGSVGYGFSSGFRTEFEFGYRQNDIDAIGGIGGAGEAAAWSGMVNFLYDFDYDWRFKPYLGFGIGAARVNFDGIAPVAGTRIDDADTGFAYQGIAGVAYDISDQLAITADYRYFGTNDLDFEADDGRGFSSDYTSHAVLLGLRYSFGGPEPAPAPAPQQAQAPAPPPPAPAPEPAPAPAPAPEAQQVPSDYLVFFDWDEATIAPEAQNVIATAAENIRDGEAARIEVTGHADRSGPADYNMGLSMRRAEAVRAELVRQGVPENEIAIFARGETDPLVPTPDGVREPQNRRVQIVIM